MGEPLLAMERTSYKSIDVIYRDGARRLVVYCEMTGPRVSYDWVASTECARAWTDPAGETIPVEEQERIKVHIAAWAKTQRTSIGFERPVPIEALFADYEAKGWVREDRPDGTVRFSPPAKSDPLSRFIRRLFK